ncbi:Tumor necrosis factor ligand superfamily member 10 [Camelus dromedarius]|uniref:Tumor necrosis factor ligand superfamily member 10 n=1 Tax=Camelus dromedarius TaxID=9838 RepID=A0A5N4EKY7_CAMDR|nr:Tumor necrosis factor ligand superfamily member 10 [Camelus dromedarius]
MASVQAPGGASPGQTCVLMLIFTVLLQSLCVAITYVYFTNELKQMILRTYEETIPTIPEKQQNIPHLEREKGPQRVAAHITGTNRRRSTFSAISSK